MNPSGSKLAICSSPGGVRIYSLHNGQIESQLTPLREGSRGFHSIKNISFSPDGKEIAGVIYPSQVAVWSIDGSLLQQESVPVAGYGLMLEEGGLSWLPDGSGWFIGGRRLIDRTTSSVIWEIKSDRHDHGQKSASCVLSNDQVLVISGQDEAREMMPVRIPWDKIREKLGTIRTDQPVDLKSGSAVTLQIEVGDLRLATQDQVSAALRTAATSLLEGVGLRHEANQPVKMVLRHSEAPENDRLRGVLFPILGGRPTGNSNAEDTKITTVIELQDSKTGSVFWRVQSDVNGSFRVRGDITEQSLRAAAFEQAVEQLGRTLLPTRLFPGSREGLPVQSIIP